MEFNFQDNFNFDTPVQTQTTQTNCYKSKTVFSMFEKSTPCLWKAIVFCMEEDKRFLDDKGKPKDKRLPTFIDKGETIKKRANGKTLNYLKGLVNEIALGIKKAQNSKFKNQTFKSAMIYNHFEEVVYQITYKDVIPLLFTKALKGCQISKDALIDYARLVRTENKNTYAIEGILIHCLTKIDSKNLSIENQSFFNYLKSAV